LLQCDGSRPGVCRNLVSDARTQRARQEIALAILFKAATKRFKAGVEGIFACAGASGLLRARLCIFVWMLKPNGLDKRTALPSGGPRWA